MHSGPFPIVRSPWTQEKDPNRPQQHQTGSSGTTALIWLSRNLECVLGGEQASVPNTATDHIRQQLRPRSLEQPNTGAPGREPSSPQACSSGDSHTKCMSQVWPGYQGNHSLVLLPKDVSTTSDSPKSGSEEGPRSARRWGIYR